MKELWKVLKEVDDDQLKELAGHICWSGVEAYIDTDGDIGYREKGSWGNFEDEILGTLTLAPEYWHDSLIEWGLYSEECRGIDDEADWSTVRDFITEWVLPEFNDTKKEM